MKKIVLALILVFALALSACGSNSDDGNTTSTAPEPEAPNSEPAEPADTSSAVFDQVAVEIKDAHLTTDYEGNPAIVITYSWTNNSDDANMAMVTTVGNAYQGGIGLDTAIIMDDPNYDSDLYSTNIQPGATLDVQCAYVLRDTTSPVTFELEEFLSLTDAKAVKEFDITALA